MLKNVQLSTNDSMHSEVLLNVFKFSRLIMKNECIKVKLTLVSICAKEVVHKVAIALKMKYINFIFLH